MPRAISRSASSRFPQQECFTEEAVTLLSAEFRVSKNTDRMGMRLDGLAVAIETAGTSFPTRSQLVPSVPGSHSRSSFRGTTRRPGVSQDRHGDLADLPVVGRSTGRRAAIAAVSIWRGGACRIGERRLAELVASLERCRKAMASIPCLWRRQSDQRRRHRLHLMSPTAAV
jgi:ferric-dicitrate binding protein FerR (iron transport regulator)